MPDVVTSEEFETPADRVWDLIAGFNTLPDYHAAVEASVLSKGGAERRLTMTDEAGGGTVVERLMSFDDEKRTFSYRILLLIDCPLPFADYRASVRLEETSAATCRVHWASTFRTVGRQTRKLRRSLGRSTRGVTTAFVVRSSCPRTPLQVNRHDDS